MPFRLPFLVPWRWPARWLAALPRPAPVAAADFTPAQREAIEGIIRDYLMHNPDVLIEALRGAEDKLNREADAKAEKVLAERRSEIFDDPATPVGGNPQGDVTIVEFFDYRCPYCKQVLPALQTPAEGGRQAALRLQGECRFSGRNRSPRRMPRSQPSGRGNTRPFTPR